MISTETDPDVSPRSGSQARKYTKQRRITPEVDEKLVVYADGKNISYNAAADKLINKALDEKVLTIDPDALEILRRDAKSKHISMSILASNYIVQGAEADIYDQDYAKKIKEKQNTSSFLAHMRKACDRIIPDGKGYSCAYHPPRKIIKLGSMTDANEKCTICLKNRFIGNYGRTRYDEVMAQGLDIYEATHRESIEYFVDQRVAFAKAVREGEEKALREQSARASST